MNDLITKLLCNAAKVLISGAVLCSVTVIAANGQDIQFSQFYAVTPYQNPAYAGSAHATRAMVHARAQWPGIDAKYYTGLVSVDHFFSKYNSGVGLMIMQDQQGLADIKSTKIDLLYSYDLTLSKMLSLRAGLQAGYGSTNINAANLVFPSQIDDDGTVSGGGPGLPLTSKGYFDIGAGLLAYTERLWGGIAFHHINRPSLTFYNAGDKANIPLKYSLTAGYKIPLRSGSHMAYLHEADNIFLTPTAHYKAQGKSDQFDIGCYLNYNQLLLGVWYRGVEFKRFESKLPNTESFAPSIGWIFYNWSIQYSYDIVVSRLSRIGSGGAHELNITYVYHKENKKHKPMKRLPCPDFYRSARHHH